MSVEFCCQVVVFEIATESLEPRKIASTKETSRKARRYILTQENASKGYIWIRLEKRHERTMAPNITATGVLFEGDTIKESLLDETSKEKAKYKITIVWRNVTVFVYLHIAALYGLYLAFTSAKWQTILFAILLYHISGLGITAGAHRLWSHRSYKAKWPLRLILVIFQTIAFQNSVYEWARDHRVHHKFSETDADPHNAKRGFWFAHFGWLICKKHPDVLEKGKGIDFSDLKSDKLVAFQHKHYKILMPLFCFVLPSIIPMLVWNDTLSNGYFVAGILRYVFTLHMTWLVNSAAHMFGNRPYDRHINPSENMAVSLVALGEGWHNYHHVFPWDYKTAELGNYKYNFTTLYIDLCAKIGWAYDLKSVSKDIVQKRVERTGDGTHEVWGWGDKDQLPEERDEALVIHPKRQ